MSGASIGLLRPAPPPATPLPRRAPRETCAASFAQSHAIASGETIALRGARAWPPRVGAPSVLLPNKSAQPRQARQPVGKDRLVVLVARDRDHRRPETQRAEPDAGVRDPPGSVSGFSRVDAVHTVPIMADRSVQPGTLG